MASVDSPKGRVKKQSLYNKQPRAQMSNLLVKGLPEYSSIISGDRYDRVVYFLISSSTEVIPILLGFNTFAVAEPKSHRT